MCFADIKLNCLFAMLNAAGVVLKWGAYEFGS